MSIITKTGDNGTTGLLYNHRVSKTHPRVQACGAVDELNAALGVARSASKESFINDNLLPIQKALTGLMGEIATLASDHSRYLADGYPVINTEIIDHIEKVAAEIEAKNISPHGWATPGSNFSAATLDMARCICRRAERDVCRLMEVRELSNERILIFLNRLSDLLWLMARWAEQPEEA